MRSGEDLRNRTGKEKKGPFADQKIMVDGESDLQFFEKGGGGKKEEILQSRWQGETNPRHKRKEFGKYHGGAICTVQKKRFFGGSLLVKKKGNL